MYRRSLAALVVASLVLTLLFASAGSAGAQQVGTQAQSCPNSDKVLTIDSRTSDVNRSFTTTGDKFRVSYTVNFKNDDADNNDFLIEITNSGFVDDDSTQQDTNGTESFIVVEDAGSFDLETRVKPQNGATYKVTVYDCRGSNNDGGGGGNGGNGDGGTVDVAQTPTDTNTASPSASDTNSATPAAEDTLTNANTDTSGNRSNSDSFRCELFLRTVRDDNGALRAQYQDDELVVQRFEQCLSGDVLADTIPNRNLPYTGGVPVLVPGTVLLVLGLLLGGWVIRRR